MSGRPTVVFFYMIGCPHCEVMRPAWNDAKGKMKNVHIEEKEARQVGSEDGVQSFPTIILKKNGKEIKRIEGERHSASEIMKDLGIRKSRRGGTRRHVRYTRQRKLRHRTLRNYKALA